MERLFENGFPMSVNSLAKTQRQVWENKNIRHPFQKLQLFLF